MTGSIYTMHLRHPTTQHAELLLSLLQLDLYVSFQITFVTFIYNSQKQPQHLTMYICKHTGI
jgi:hypothetical protein